MAQNFLNFTQLFGKWKIYQSRMLAPPRILDPPLCRLGLFVLRDEATIRSHGGCERRKQHKSILGKFSSLVTRLNTNIHQGKFNKTQVTLPIKNRSLTEHSVLPEGNVGSVGCGGLCGSRNEIDRVLRIYINKSHIFESFIRSFYTKPTTIEASWGSRCLCHSETWYGHFPWVIHPQGEGKLVILNLKFFISGEGA